MCLFPQYMIPNLARSDNPIWKLRILESLLMTSRAYYTIHFDRSFPKNNIHAWYKRKHTKRETHWLGEQTSRFLVTNRFEHQLIPKSTSTLQHLQSCEVCFFYKSKPKNIFFKHFQVGFSSALAKTFALQLPALDLFAVCNFIIILYSC